MPPAAPGCAAPHTKKPTPRSIVERSSEQLFARGDETLRAPYFLFLSTLVSLAVWSGAGAPARKQTCAMAAKTGGSLVIGVTGRIGAGKGAVVEYLAKSRGFVHYSARSFLLETIREKGLPENRDSMVLVANALRKEKGPSAVIEALLERARSGAKGQQPHCIIESVRTVGETEALRQAGAYLLGVDAPADLRFKRIKQRKSSTDDISFETFLEHEAREEAQTEPHKANIAAVMKKADAIVDNSGSLEDLATRVEKVLVSWEEASCGTRP